MQREHNLVLMISIALGKVAGEDMLCLTDQELIRIDSNYLKDQSDQTCLSTDRQELSLFDRTNYENPQRTNRYYFVDGAVLQAARRRGPSDSGPSKHLPTPP